MADFQGTGRGRSVLYKLSFLIGDLFALALAHVISVYAAHRILHIPIAAIDPAHHQRYFVPLFISVLYLCGGYESPELRRPERELEKMCKAVAISFLVLPSFHLLFLGPQKFYRYQFFAWFASACLLLVFVRLLLRTVYALLWKSGVARRNVLVIGSETTLVQYKQLLDTQRYQGHRVVEWVRASQELSCTTAAEIPSTGSLTDLEQVIDSSGADLLVLALPALPDGVLRQILRQCRQKNLQLELYSSVLAAQELNWELDEFSGCVRVSARPTWSLAVQRVFKRVMDIAIGFVGSAVTLILIPVVYMVVNAEDRGPVFHLREYVSTDGTIRYYRKFRTMLKDADDVLRCNPELKARFLYQYKLKDDPRLLRVGRFMRRYSIDEFPQFFSLLSGALSFVGPRVISAEERSRYGALLPKLLSAKPGLTGFWQVMGRQTTTYEERIHMDMFYIDRWSIWLDLIIVAKTFWKVLTAEGAY